MQKSQINRPFLKQETDIIKCLLGTWIKGKKLGKMEQTLANVVVTEIERKLGTLRALVLIFIVPQDRCSWPHFTD